MGGATGDWNAACSSEEGASEGSADWED